MKRTYGFAALRAAFTLRRFLRIQKVQIVQTFFESSDLWGGLIAKTMSDAKLVWSRRDMGILRSGKHRMAYRFMSGLPDAVFAVSEQVRQHCVMVDGIDPRRVITIYNGLNLSTWNLGSSAGAMRSRVHITTVGNIRRVKGHDIFIRAAESILSRYPNVTFSIVGEVLEDEYFQELQSLVQDLNLYDSFRFIGSGTNIPDHLNKADIFVLPSRSEGFSNAILEAMAASLPVVATDVGGNAEAVIEGITGFIVPAESPSALSTAVERLLADPHHAKAMGAAGRVSVEERFTSEVMMRMITDAYKALLSPA